MNFTLSVFLKDIYVSDKTADTAVTLNFSSPEFFLLQLSDETLSASHIQLDVISENDACMSVAIQEARCPIEKPEDNEGVLTYFTVRYSNLNSGGPSRVLLKVS